MPRRNTRRGRGSGRRSGRGGLPSPLAVGLGGRRMISSCQVQGTDILTMTYNASFSFNTFSVKPSGFVRLTTIRTCFELYKFTRLRFTLLPVCSGVVTMGYDNGRNITNPSGFANTSVIQCDCNAMWWPGQIEPMVIDVPAAVLNRRQMKLMTTNDTDGPFGIFFVGGPTSTAVTALVRVDYTCVLSDAISTGMQSSSVEDEKRETPVTHLPTSPSWADMDAAETLSRERSLDPPSLQRQSLAGPVRRADSVLIPGPTREGAGTHQPCIAEPYEYKSQLRVFTTPQSGAYGGAGPRRTGAD